MVTLIIEDLVSRKCVGDVMSSEETHIQVQVAFEAALKNEGLWQAALERARQIGLQQPVPARKEGMERAPQLRLNTTVKGGTINEAPKIPMLCESNQKNGH